MSIGTYIFSRPTDKYISLTLSITQTRPHSEDNLLRLLERESSLSRSPQTNRFPVSLFAVSRCDSFREDLLVLRVWSSFDFIVMGAGRTFFFCLTNLLFSVIRKKSAARHRRKDGWKVC